MNKKKIITLVSAVVYLILVMILTINLPSLLSFGNENVKTVILSGQTAAIYEKTVDITGYQDQLKKGQTVFISDKAGALQFSISPNEGFQRALILGIDGNKANIKLFVSGTETKTTPGMLFFQIIIALLLIIIPIIIFKKSGFSLDGGPIFGDRSNGKSKNKYGNQGTSYQADISELKSLSGAQKINIDGEERIVNGFTISKNFRLSANKSYEHVVVIGPTGAGKSSSFFIPNILDLDGTHSAVITDPKGEMYDLTAEHLKNRGYNVIKLCPLKPDKNEFHYNPLSMATDSQKIQELAQLILINGGKSIEMATGSSASNGEWINMSVPLFAAALAYVKRFGKRKSISEAIDFIFDNLNDLKKTEQILSRDPFALKQFKVFLSSTQSEATAASIKSVLMSNVQLFLEEKIENFTTAPMGFNAMGKRIIDESMLFNPETLREAPTVLFVCVPEDKATYMMPLMSVFYTQLFNMTFERSDGCPVLFFLDEFANIGIIPSITQVASTARSRRIGLSIGIQGIDQLKFNYGPEKAMTLMNNLKTKMVYSGLSGDENLRYVSDLAGVTTVETKSVSGKDGQVSHSGTRRELLTTDEVRTMDENLVLIIAHNKHPVFDRKNTWFTNEKYKKLLK